MATLINCRSLKELQSVSLSVHPFPSLTLFGKVPIRHMTTHLLTNLIAQAVLTGLNLSLFSLAATKICLAQREYDTVRIGLPPNKISYYVEINYYPDKELLVKTQTGCLRACSMENEFICRSILYRANYKPGQPSKLPVRHN